MAAFAGKGCEHSCTAASRERSARAAGTRRSTALSPATNPPPEPAQEPAANRRAACLRRHWLQANQKSPKRQLRTAPAGQPIAGRCSSSGQDACRSGDDLFRGAGGERSPVPAVAQAARWAPQHGRYLSSRGASPEPLTAAAS